MFSCDTILAWNQRSGNFLAKNSDREPNEPHEIVFVPAKDHPLHSQLQVTYSSIKQVSHTHAVLLFRPSWMWGAEMGVNEHGVVAANEAIFSHVTARSLSPTSLTGMDIVRLVLERAATAKEAVSVTIELLKQYGQGGNCGFSHAFFYHNGFIFADHMHAYVMLTVGREWAYQPVLGLESVSNFIHFGGLQEGYQYSPGLVEMAVKNRWCSSTATFDMSKCYSDWLYTKFGKGEQRRSTTLDLLTQACTQGDISVETMMGILRHHHSNVAHGLHDPSRGFLQQDVCMHASGHPIRVSQTTGSLVAWWAPGKRFPLLFVTGTSSPCLSWFKPIFCESLLTDPEQAVALFGPSPSRLYDGGRSLWWKHERLHRRLILSYDSVFVARYRKSCARLEKVFCQQAIDAYCGSHVAEPQLLSISMNAFADGMILLDMYYAQVVDEDPPRSASLWHRLAWFCYNWYAGIHDAVP